jgi:hypothetical protein
MYLIITIDTEGDNQWNSDCRNNITTENARYLPRFQKLCERYGFKPTYLTNYEMAQDEFFVDFAKSCLKRGVCEIGSHPHAWNSPPEFDLTGNDREHYPYLMEYPEEIIYEKLKYLTELLENTFGVKIVSHRAGRWGLNNIYAKILEEMDYNVDCTVTPSLCWAKTLGDPNQKGGPDFRGFPTRSYFMNVDNISERGNSNLLEIPVTTRQNFNRVHYACYKICTSKAKKAFCYIFGPEVWWFRPNKRNIKDLIRIYENESISGSSYIMFMLHSSELMPGGNQVFIKDKDIEKLYKDLDHLFRFLSQRNVIGATCSEFYSYKQEVS